MFLVLCQYRGLHGLQQTKKVTNKGFILLEKINVSKRRHTRTVSHWDSTEIGDKYICYLYICRMSVIINITTNKNIVLKIINILNIILILFVHVSTTRNFFCYHNWNSTERFKVYDSVRTLTSFCRISVLITDLRISLFSKFNLRYISNFVWPCRFVDSFDHTSTLFYMYLGRKRNVDQLCRLQVSCNFSK